VLSYLTAGTDQFIGKVVEQGVVPLLVSFTRNLSRNRATKIDHWLQVQNLAPLQTQGPLALPLIRTFGNIASGPDEYTDVLLSQDMFLPGLIVLCNSDCRYGVLQ
jgi:hypothetical protein